MHLRFHTLTGISLQNYLGLLLRHGFDPTCLPQVAFLFWSGMLASPLRYIDRWRSSAKVSRHTIQRPPIFVIGHPRSGTTHLHNLLCRDPQFGYVTTFHCNAATMFLGATETLRKLMLGALPDTRPMDNVRVGLDEPQEEEMAMARISSLSYNHGLHFPRKMREIFHSSVLFADNGQSEQRWKRAYIWFLRRVSYEQDGKQLCLKNPCNMARIPSLLEIFPQARFIHICRNSYVVYQSSMNLWKQVLPLLALQKYDLPAVEENILYFYRRMHECYFADKDHIPSGRLTEIRFEDLEADPLGTQRQIYSDLQLDGFETAQPALEEYLRSLRGYQKNHYDFPSLLRRRVYQHWSSTIDRWGYQVPVT